MHTYIYTFDINNKVFRIRAMESTKKCGYLSLSLFDMANHQVACYMSPSIMHRNLSFIFILVVSHWLYWTLLKVAHIYSRSLELVLSLSFSLSFPLTRSLAYSTRSLSLSLSTHFTFFFLTPSFSSFFLFNNTSFTGVCHRFLRVETTWRDKHTPTHTGQCSTKHNGDSLAGMACLICFSFRNFELIIREQPVHSRMCGVGERGKVPTMPWSPDIYTLLMLTCLHAHSLLPISSTLYRHPISWSTTHWSPSYCTTQDCRPRYNKHDG